MVIDTDDPLRAIESLPEPAEILTEETSGRSRQMFVRHLDAAMIAHLRERPGVTDVRTRVATLEEIFVAYTTQRQPSEIVGVS